MDRSFAASAADYQVAHTTIAARANVASLGVEPSRRSVTRGPDRTQKPGSEQTHRGRWRADC